MSSQSAIIDSAAECEITVPPRMQEPTLCYFERMKLRYNLKKDASVRSAKREVRKLQKEVRALNRCEPKFPVEDYGKFFSEKKTNAIVNLETATNQLMISKAVVQHSFHKSRFTAMLATSKTRADFQQNLAENAFAKAVIAKDKVVFLESQLAALAAHDPALTPQRPVDLA